MILPDKQLKKHFIIQVNAWTWTKIFNLQTIEESDLWKIVYADIEYSLGQKSNTIVSEFPVSIIIIQK